MTELARPVLALMRLAVGRRQLGDRFTVADLNVASVMNYTRAGNFDARPAFNAK